MDLKIKNGDEVICIDNHGISNRIKLYKIYKVIFADTVKIRVAKYPSYVWGRGRFRNVTNIPDYKIVAFILTKNLDYLKK